MLHHVGIEVAPAEIEAAAGFFELIGFERVEPPATLSEFTWLEREGTQIHLMPTEEPTVPSPGHLAVVAPDFDATVCPPPRRRLRGRAETRTLGQPRAWRSPPAATGSS